ncbi:exosome complex component RRP41-like [Histomonas meleagridis]|uniref:exosome complex component RRP41-like n=1 Tax=Histomonas meleagridis TaxID=135588 RepID=UPI003559B8DF|nr:exosome complex component RRP41-like [Histomonas meleagridis]KAH0805400.1 exosome complex component RRP41-like [Histomonas meleagridis]
MDVYNEFTGLRQDGRRPNEMRFIEAKNNVIPGCTGSSHFKMGQTEVISQVFGPSEGRGGDRELAEVNVKLEFANFAKSPHVQDTTKTRRSRESEIIIKRIFETAIRREQYPSSQIDISITIIQDDGSFQSAAINATTLALIDGGIPMYDFVVSLSAAYIADQAFLDTGRNESSTRFPVLEVAVLPSSNQIVSMNMTSRISPEAAKQLTEIAVDGCLKLHLLLANIARQSAV